MQIGENTIEAFEAAIRIGDEFVEFDVQVTKDLVPVIYHDFLVSETGTDAPVHTLSYSQMSQSRSLLQAWSREALTDHHAVSELK